MKTDETDNRLLRYLSESYDSNQGRLSFTDVQEAIGPINLGDLQERLRRYQKHGLTERFTSHSFIPTSKIMEYPPRPNYREKFNEWWNASPWRSSLMILVAFLPILAAIATLIGFVLG